MTENEPNPFSLSEKDSNALDTLDTLANVSHEIRNPLNAIIGLSQLLKTACSEEDREEYVDGLLQTSENLLEIVNNLMDFSKLKSGRLSLNKKPVNLKKVVSASLSGHKLLAENKQLDFYLELEQEIPALLLLDSFKLNQVIVNLVSNAIKFTEEGKVTVKVKVLSITATDAFLSFSVKDTGVGISKENQAKIFKAFDQGDAEINANYGGTGLGLTISKVLLEMMGSDLQVKSELGKGAEFSFGISLEIPQQEAEKASPLEELVPKKGLNVLVVDDNKLNRLVASKNLRQWNIACETAASGLEALHLLKQEDFDLVLMDLRMPEMNGHETLERIRGIERYKELPVIALTGSLGSSERDALLEDGFSDYLLKPFRPEELLRRVVSLTV